MALPVAAIICIVLAVWVVVVLVIFALYQLLKTRGSCSCECAPCGKEGDSGCSECCISLSESCNCCNPSVGGCLDSICPGKKKVNCVDIVLCQCCANEGEESCCVKMCCCFCRDCECDCCDSDCCSCCNNCESLVCCCLEIRLVSQAEKVDASAVKYSASSQQVETKLKPPSQGNIKTAQKNGSSSSGDKKTFRPLPDGLSSVRSVSSARSAAPSTARSVSTARSTPGSVNTARSVSQVEFTSDSKVNKRTPRTKMNSNSSVSEKSDKVVSKVSSGSTETRNSKGGSRALPLPRPPRATSKTSSGTAQKSGTKTPRKRKESEGGDLVEVPVKQSVPLHACLSPRGVSETDLSMAAYPQYNGQLINYANMQMSASDMQMYSNEAVSYVNNGYSTNGFIGDSSVSGQLVSGRSLESLIPSGRSLQSTGSSRPRPLPIAR